MTFRGGHSDFFSFEDNTELLCRHLKGLISSGSVGRSDGMSDD